MEGATTLSRKALQFCCIASSKPDPPLSTSETLVYQKTRVLLVLRQSYELLIVVKTFAVLPATKIILKLQKIYYFVHLKESG